MAMDRCGRCPLHELDHVRYLVTKQSRAFITTYELLKSRTFAENHNYFLTETEYTQNLFQRRVNVHYGVGIIYVDIEHESK